MPDKEKTIAMIESEINVAESHNQCYRAIDLPALRDILDLLKEQERLKAYWFISEYEYLTCSNCGFNYYTGCESTNEAKENYKKPFDLYFCPYCGAKMTRRNGSYIGTEDIEQEEIL